MKRGGSIDSIELAGDAVISNGGVLPVTTFTNTAPGTFTKRGGGQLSVDNTSGTALMATDTVFRIEGGQVWWLLGEDRVVSTERLLEQGHP